MGRYFSFLALLLLQEQLALGLQSMRAVAFATRSPMLRMSATLEPPAAGSTLPLAGLPRITPLLSGLQGKALRVEASDVPSKAAVRKVIPDHCYERDTLRSMGHVAMSTALTAACVACGLFIPLHPFALPLWLAYAAVTGTVAFGLWIQGHECGHGAWSDNKVLQDAVGFVLHTALLVPYFSWQRSHAVHHAHTNHIHKGESHVPTVAGARAGGEEGKKEEGHLCGEEQVSLARSMGPERHAAFQLATHLLVGWPAYLHLGYTGGAAQLDEERRAPNHFWPGKPFSDTLWSGRWEDKVMQSSAGIGVVFALLAWWASQEGWEPVVALYGGPILVVNAWLIVYTWLQHTDVDVPHLGSEDHSYMRGAFLTIDRPYPPLIDWLHHRIGTTHVAHHIDCTIPHYHAREATEAIAAAFPDAYLYEPTPVHEALWRVAANCVATERSECGRYIYVPAYEEPAYEEARS